MPTLAREIMSKNVRVIHENESLRRAAETLASDDVGALPIVSSDESIRGMLTDRDIVVQAVARGRDVNTTTARDLEQGDVVVLRPDDPVEEAADLMARHKIRRLPVVDNRRVVGLVSQADIAKCLDPERAGRMLSAISSR